MTHAQWQRLADEAADEARLDEAHGDQICVDPHRVGCMDPIHPDAETPVCRGCAWEGPDDDVPPTDLGSENAEVDW